MWRALAFITCTQRAFMVCLRAINIFDHIRGGVYTTENTIGEFKFNSRVFFFFFFFTVTRASIRTLFYKEIHLTRKILSRVKLFALSSRDEKSLSRGEMKLSSFTLNCLYFFLFLIQFHPRTFFYNN